MIKKRLIAILLVFLLFGCNQNNKNTEKIYIEKVTTQVTEINKLFNDKLSKNDLTNKTNDIIDKVIKLDCPDEKLETKKEIDDLFMEYKIAIVDIEATSSLNINPQIKKISDEIKTVIEKY